MHPRSPQLLEDVRDAAAFIMEVTRGIDAAEFAGNRVLRQAVERNFEIIGEAIKRIAAADPQTVAGITQHARIIAFRNILIHGYDALDHVLILGAAQSQVPVLLTEVLALLGRA